MRCKYERLLSIIHQQLNREPDTIERFIRPLSGERKNSLFFGSGTMARVSVVYHTLISTCKMQGVSALQYFKMFFQAIVNGRRDYENLLPITIGLGNNKL